MKKIMFNDEFLLTQATLDGRKTMTRRLVGDRMTEADIIAYLRGYPEVAFEHAPFKIGEVVAVAQSYSNIYMSNAEESYRLLAYSHKDEPGWNNKMFVKPDLMPTKIKFTGMYIERLQTISPEDCIKEGITGHDGRFFVHNKYGVVLACRNPKFAFRFLIDRVCGIGTWKDNPWVYAYEYERVKEKSTFQ